MIIEVMFATAVLSLAISSFVMAYLMACRQEYQHATKQVKDQADEFATIVKAASDANNTHAQHIIKLEARIESLEFRNNNMALEKSSWGKKG